MPAKKHISLLLLLLVLLGGFFGAQWLLSDRPPLPEAIVALESDELVRVTQDPWLTFEPAQYTPDTGLIFYPGGRIDPRGYATLMRAIATEGYLVVVPEMPLNTAAFRPNAADEIMAHHHTISRWVIAGHSIGGIMAAQFASTHPESVAGLAMWAAYPANNADLSHSDVSAALIYGSHDPRVDDESIDKRRQLLADDTTIVRIDGGDHHQFGSYEIAPEDNHATIDRASQQQQITQATLRLLESAAPPAGG